MGQLFAAFGQVAFLAAKCKPAMENGAAGKKKKIKVQLPPKPTHPKIRNKISENLKSRILPDLGEKKMKTQIHNLFAGKRARSGCGFQYLADLAVSV